MTPFRGAPRGVGLCPTEIHCQDPDSPGRGVFEHEVLLETTAVLPRRFQVWSIVAVVWSVPSEHWIASPAARDPHGMHESVASSEHVNARSVPRSSPSLSCAAVPVPGGVRLLADDGTSYLLSGATLEEVRDLQLPPRILHSLTELGLVTRAAPWRIHVLGDGPGVPELAAALNSMDEVTATCRRHDVLESPTATLHRLRHRSRTPDLVVVVPRDLLGGRGLVQLARRHRIPTAVAWLGRSMAFLGPINEPHRPRCQRCLDLALARRDLSWAQCATMLRSTPADAPALGALSLALLRRLEQDTWGTWWSWSRRGERSGTVPVHPLCHRCQVLSAGEHGEPLLHAMAA